MGRSLDEITDSLAVGRRCAAIEMAIPACINAMRSGKSSPEELGASASDLLKRQISIASTLSPGEGLHLRSMSIAGEAITAETNSEIDDADLLLSNVMTIVDDIGFSDEEVRLGDGGAKGQFMQGLVKLWRLFTKLPMGNDVHTSIEFTAAMISSIVNEVVGEENTPETMSEKGALIPGVVSLVEIAWSSTASGLLNPGGSYVLPKDVERILGEAMFDTVVSMPLGHAGNEESVVRILASYIYELSTTMASSLHSQTPVIEKEAYKAALVRRFLVPLTKLAWKRLVEDLVHNVDTKSGADLSDFLMYQAGEPLDLQLVFVEVQKLARARKSPIDLVTIDLYEFEIEVKRQFSSLWGLVLAIEEMLPYEIDGAVNA